MFEMLVIGIFAFVAFIKMKKGVAATGADKQPGMEDILSSIREIIDEQEDTKAAPDALLKMNRKSSKALLRAHGGE